MGCVSLSAAFRNRQSYSASARQDKSPRRDRFNSDDGNPFQSQLGDDRAPAPLPIPVAPDAKKRQDELVESLNCLVDSIKEKTGERAGDLANSPLKLLPRNSPILPRIRRRVGERRRFAEWRRPD